MWEKIDLDQWRETLSVCGRVATQEDVENGRAVFVIPSGSAPYDVRLPSCALQTDHETMQKVPCIAIQAEETDRSVFIGVRYLDGGNGVCALEEIEFYEDAQDLVCV